MHSSFPVHLCIVQILQHMRGNTLSLIDLPPIKRSALGFLFYHNLYHVIPDITPKVNKSVQLMSPAFISKTVTDDVHLLLVLLYLYHMRIEYIVFFQIWKIIFNKRALWIGPLVAYVTVTNIFNTLKIIVKRYTAFSDCIKHCIVCFFNFLK